MPLSAAISAERDFHRRDALRRRLAAGGLLLQRLDVGLDLDLGAELVAQRRLQPVGDIVRRAERELALDLEIERDGTLAADVVHGDVMHRETLVARDHHDALLDRLGVERARRDRDDRLGAGQVGADGFRDIALQRLDPVERQRAAHRRHHLDEQLVAGRPHPHAVDRDHAAHFREPRGSPSAAEPAGAVSVSVSMVRRPSRQPARHTNRATTRAAAESAHWKPSATPAKPDQHGDRRPHVGAEMQRVGFERFARGFAGDPVEQRARGRNRR